MMPLRQVSAPVPMPAPVPVPDPRAIACLTRFLANELEAVASYHQARYGFATPWDTDWGICLEAHQAQGRILAGRIHDLGGQATDAAAPWPAVVAALATVDADAGLRLVHRALRAGEDRGLAVYLSRMPDLDPDSSRLVTRSVLPSQFLAHEAMRRICGQRVLSLVGGAA